MPKNSNLAYDFARFEQTTAKPAPQKQPQIKKVGAAKPKKKFHPALFTMSLLTIVSVCAFLIYSGVRLNEVTDESNTIAKQIEILKNEEIRQTMAIESMFSMQNVEDYAENVLGMQKMDKSQVQYISLTSDNCIEIPNDRKENVFEKIQGFFEDLVEKVKKAF